MLIRPQIPFSYCLEQTHHILSHEGPWIYSNPCQTRKSFCFFSSFLYWSFYVWLLSCLLLLHHGLIDPNFLLQIVGFSSIGNYFFVSYTFWNCFSQFLTLRNRSRSWLGEVSWSDWDCISDYGNLDESCVFNLCYQSIYDHYLHGMVVVCLFWLTNLCVISD